MKSLSIVRFYNDNPKKNTQIFGAIDEKENVIGEIELENEEGFIDIVNIYVDPKARRKGVGTYLLQSVLNYLCEISLFLNVEIRFPLNKESQGLYDFFDFQDNFDVEREDKVFHVSAKDRIKLNKWSKLASGSSDAVPFFELSKKQIKDFAKKMNELDHDEPIPENLDTLEKSMCFARIENKQVAGALFTQKFEEAKQLMITFLYSEEQGPSTLLNLISAAAETVEKNFKDYEIIFTSENPKIFGMVDGIFEGKVTVTPFVTATWNGLSVNAMSFLNEQAV